MIDLKAIRARDALISQVWNGEPTGQADQDRRALIKAYDELVAERALLVTRAENAEAALTEAGYALDLLRKYSPSLYEDIVKEAIAHLSRKGESHE